MPKFNKGDIITSAIGSKTSNGVYIENIKKAEVIAFNKSFIPRAIKIKILEVSGPVKPTYGYIDYYKKNKIGNGNGPFKVGSTIFVHEISFMPYAERYKNDCSTQDSQGNSAPASIVTNDTLLLLL